MSSHLILGGARSGKSLFAERLALSTGLKVTYIATAQASDDEFRKRILHHQTRRPKDWMLVEEPHYLARKLKELDASDKCLMVDCLTLLVAQWICNDCNSPLYSDFQSETTALLKLIPELKATVILVSNEVGMGIVPLGEINRQFQDEQGRLNQSLAISCSYVTLIVAGLPLKLK